MPLQKLREVAEAFPVPLAVLACAISDVALVEITAAVLAKIDAALEANGTDKTRLLSAQIWLKDIRDRGAMNELWTAWLPAGGAPARACVEANMADPRHLVEIMVTACR